MYKKFVLELNSGSRTCDIAFDILSTPIAQKWAIELSKNYPLYETNRFQGWDPNLTLEYFETALQEQIASVNRYRPNTVNIEQNIFDQQYLNYLHRFFEDLRGEAATGTDFFNTAPADVQQAIEKFNVLIHECEHHMRDQSVPTIIGTFKDRPRIELAVDDFKEFTFQWQFGCVYINYCEVGKPLLDVYKDNDTTIPVEAVRPLKYYSADFMIKFGPNVAHQHYQARLEDFWNWYRKTNYTFDEDRLALGYIPVAQLSYTDNQFLEMSNLEIINQITQYNTVKSVLVK
jgi:hypothetical protein